MSRDEGWGRIRRHHSFNYRAGMPNVGKAKQRHQHILIGLAKMSIWIFPFFLWKKPERTFGPTQHPQKKKKYWDSNWG